MRKRYDYLGMSAVHGGIDLSWGMYANKSWEDGTITPKEYWALADTWNPNRFKPRQWGKAAKKAGFRDIVLKKIDIKDRFVIAILLISSLSPFLIIQYFA
jgi:hypothetical protein